MKKDWRKTKKGKKQLKNYYKNWKKSLVGMQSTKIAAEKYRNSIKGIFKSLKWSARGRNINFYLTLDEFTVWYNNQNKKCYYCEIPEKLSSKMKWGKKNILRLSFERVDNDKGYFLDNMVLSCLRCNGIKSDFFNKTEMKSIAKKYIKPKWTSIVC